MQQVNQVMKQFNDTKKQMKAMIAKMPQQTTSKKGKKGKKGKKAGFGRINVPGMGPMKMSDLKKFQDMMDGQL